MYLECHEQGVVEEQTMCQNSRRNFQHNYSLAFLQNYTLKEGIQNKHKKERKKVPHRKQYFLKLRFNLEEWMQISSQRDFFSERLEVVILKLAFLPRSFKNKLGSEICKLFLRSCRKIYPFFYAIKLLGHLFY